MKKQLSRYNLVPLSIQITCIVLGLILFITGCIPVTPSLYEATNTSDLPLKPLQTLSPSPNATFQNTLIQPSPTSNRIIRPQGTVFFSDNNWIYAIDLLKKDFVPIMTSGRNTTEVFWNISGSHNQYIYFVLDKLLNQSTDIFRVEFGGNSLEQLSFKGNTSFFRLSPDGIKVAYVVGSGSSLSPDKLFVLNLEDRSSKQLKSESDGQILDVFWSPDSNIIAYTEKSNLESDAIHLLSFNLSNNGIVEFAPTWKMLSAKPAWSPDGQFIVFSSLNTKNEQGIYILNVKQETANLLATITDADNFSWSPDGKNILFESTTVVQNGNQLNLTFLNVDTKQVVNIQNRDNNNGHDFNPLWSTDGVDIAYFTKSNNDELDINIYRVENGGRFALAVPGAYADSLAGGVWISGYLPIPQVGHQYRITTAGDNLMLNKSPSVNSVMLRTLHTGESVTLIGGPEIADHYIWRQLRTEDGTKGWVIEIPEWFNPASDNPTSSLTP